MLQENTDYMRKFGNEINALSNGIQGIDQVSYLLEYYSDIFKSLSISEEDVDDNLPFYRNPVMLRGLTGLLFELKLQAADVLKAVRERAKEYNKGGTLIRGLGNEGI